MEGFKNMEYVPKISDMGLGKQLAGQSSFGLSTLGTGSVGGPAGNASVAGAGAGSAGRNPGTPAGLQLRSARPIHGAMLMGSKSIRSQGLA